MKKSSLALLLVAIITLSQPVFSQYSQISDLEIIPVERLSGNSHDWLLTSFGAEAGLFRNSDSNELILTNGIISRSFRIAPNAATVSLKVLSTQQEHIRAIKPEAVVTINGFTMDVGGLTGQPNLAFLYPDWLNEMEADPLSFRFKGFTVEKPEKRLEWKQVRHHAPNTVWPPKGIKLTMDYQLGNVSLDDLMSLSTASGKLDHSELIKIEKKLNELKDVVITINYELYDGIPAMSKWVSIKNLSGSQFTVDNITSEYLAIADHDPAGGYRNHDDLKIKPNIHFETDYTFSAMKNSVANSQSVHWGIDKDYVTQISWLRDILNTMRIYPEKGYYQEVNPGETFNSIHAFMIPYDSYDKERNGLALRKMYRIIAPWLTENPMMLHITVSEWDDYVNAVDQAAEVGYEMVNFSFGSGFNAEDESEKNYDQMRKYAQYADTKGIKIGTYSLLASRAISDKDDVINPKTGKRGGFATFGNSPCLCSEWGQEYFRKMYRMFTETGFMTFTHDGSYPGDVCASTTHPGHKGLEDSQFKQWTVISNFYKWCKSKGIYLRIPDYYYLVGGNQCGVGYRESNWSLPRRHQLIHTRQNIYDGTWESLPSMRWSFIPLTQYHGGGAAATIEPLHEHLDHYEMMLVSNIGMGIQSALRGPRLYDADETKAMLIRVVSWYKKYRDILESDIIHLRRADGRDLDYMMHVNPALQEKGFLLVFNPTDEPITKTITVPLYYTGLTENAKIREQGGTATTYSLDREYKVKIEVTVKPNWYNWFVIE